MGAPMILERRYHVPRNQVWEGSRGRQTGRVHFHVTETVNLDRGLRRSAGEALCSRKHGWYERPPVDGEQDCPECVARAARHGLELPA